MRRKRGTALTVPPVDYISVHVLPVVPDVLHVIVVLQHVDELGHVLQVALAAEVDVVLGHHLHLGADEGVSLGLFNNSKVSILVAFSPCMS